MYIIVSVKRATLDPALSAIMNIGIAVYMYITRCAVMDFSSNGVQQLKAYFSNNSDSYKLAPFGFSCIYLQHLL
jgi:hypothetical protein